MWLELRSSPCSRTTVGFLALEVAGGTTTVGGFAVTAVDEPGSTDAIG